MLSTAAAEMVELQVDVNWPLLGTILVLLMLSGLFLVVWLTRKRRED
jgi:hypothetical protein